MISKLAIRNLLEHRSKSLIVGGLIALGVSLLVLGNSVMDSISLGMRQSFTEQYSGDLFIFSPVEDEGELSIFGSFGTEGLEPLERFSEVETQLKELPNIKLVSKMTVGMGTLESEMGEQTYSMFWGIDPSVWNQSFAKHLNWIEGGLWQGNEPSIALPKTVVDEIGEAQGQPLKIGEAILITVMGDNGIKIREATLSGVFEFETITAPQLEMMSLIDLKTSQLLLSLDSENLTEVTLNESESSVLGSVSDEGLFGDDGLFGASDSDDSFISNTNIVAMDELNQELELTLKRDKNTETNFISQYHFAVVQLENPSLVTQSQQDVQTWISENNLNWRVGDWQSAAGFLGTMVNSIKVVLNSLVLIVAFVSTLIIMNTLVISVTERLQEIGTMRAIGAQKSFVRKMVLAETMMLAFVAVIVGVIVAGIILAVVNINGIAASSHFLEIMFGGDVLFPALSFAAIGEASALMITGALIACLYPLAIALKVSPLKAMQG